MNLKQIFKPPIIQEWTSLLREKGLKAFVREKGWKVVAAVFMFYLIRDSIMYILIPVLITQGFICGN
ncbi:hypothetical protein KJ068_14595 [bacterium]|nr:MAG: hypothetical protein EDS67_21225 [candidate division KSB1 bacterium]MCE7943617.1 hypothetical protein [Chlorobi bacterium CHB1]MCL4706395.1 hypothetical protein [bacterium]MDL1876242.1 hypothetical protein [Cytophagia bacterium CHB2]MBC6947197.1 hypothetical protein [candidate division KSB1 bacterium]